MLRVSCVRDLPLDVQILTNRPAGFVIEASTSSTLLIPPDWIVSFLVVISDGKRPGAMAFTRTPIAAGPNLKG